MAEVKLTGQFPEGTSVSAYLDSNWPTPGTPSGAPVGSAAATATVSGGVVALTGLSAGATYFAVGTVGSDYRYVKVTVPAGAAASSTVELSGEPTVKVSDGSGPITVDGTVAVSELPAGTKAIGQTDPRGNVAHDGVDAGNPVKVGGRARTSHTAAVSNDDRSDLTFDKYGRLLVANAIPDTQVSETVNLTNETSTQVLAAPGENVRLVVTAILATNASAAVSTKLEILDEATKKMAAYLLKGGGGFEITNRNGLFIATANKPVKAKCVTTGADVDVFISGYKIPA